MSRLLEILGRAVTVDVAELILNWLKITLKSKDDTELEKNSQLNKILTLIDEKKYDSATHQLRLYLFENPACIYGRLAAAAVCLHNNQLFEAIKELNSVYSSHPNNTIALYALGHCYERLGKEAQAIEFYQDCLKFKRYLQLPAQRLAAIYFKNNQIEKTIQQYELLSSEYPEDISALVTLGYLYIHAGKYSQAGESFNRAILMYPDNSNADYYIDQLIENEQVQEAIEYIEELLQIYPDRCDLILKYGDILYLSGATAQAAEQYERAVHSSPDFLEARIKLGMYYLRAEQELLAAEQFNRAFDINDNIVDAYIGLSLSQHLSKDFSRAAETLSLAASIQANSSILFTETACIHLKHRCGNSEIYHYQQNDMPKAVIESHRQQIFVSGHNADLYYRYGILMMNYNRLSDAISAFENALEINPHFSGAYNKLAICLLQSGRCDEAFYRLENYLCLKTDIVKLHYKTAILYCDRLKFASSVLNLQNNFYNNFSSIEAAQSISIILQNLSLLDRTTVMWDSILETTNNTFIDSHDQFYQ